MASGTIRIIRDETPKAGGGIGGTSVESNSASGVKLPHGIEPEPSVESASSPGPTTARRRRATEAKRSALSVEDRSPTERQAIGGAKSNRTTPAPTSNQSAGPSPRYRRSPVFYSASEAEATAKFVLSAVEMVGVVSAGPIGEMTEFERGMLTPPMQRILQRTPVTYMERALPMMDLAFLVIGGAMYFNRISGGIRFPSRPQTKGVQEDKASPVAAPVESTVSRTRAGDIDGIAPPIPTEITAHMNGSI